MDNEDKIERVIGRFNFENVHKAMTAVGWTWHEKDVPTIEQMEDVARGLLRDVLGTELERHFSKCSTGGFEATREGENIYLDFVLEEANWETSEQETV